MVRHESELDGDRPHLCHKSTLTGVGQRGDIVKGITNQRVREEAAATRGVEGGGGAELGITLHERTDWE